MRQLIGPLTRVSDLCWSPNGKLLASSTAGPALEDGPVIRAWSVANGRVVSLFDESGVFFNERRWIARLTSEVRMIHPGDSNLVFGPGGYLFASHFKRLVKWDLATGARQEIEGCPEGPLSISADGGLLLSSGGKLWDTKTWAELPGPLNGAWSDDDTWETVESATFGTTGEWYAWCSSIPDEKYDPGDVKVGITESRSGELMEVVQRKLRNIAYKMAFDEARDRIVVREMDRFYSKWRSPQSVAVWTRDGLWKKRDLGIEADEIAVSADGRLLAAIRERWLAVRSLDSGDEWKVDCECGALTAVAISPDGSTVAVGGESGVISLIEVKGAE